MMGKVCAVPMALAAAMAATAHADEKAKNTQTQPGKQSAASQAEVRDPVVARAEKAIALSATRFLNNKDHTPWQIMHGLLALRQNYVVKDPAGKKINALKWISAGPTHRGVSWFQKTAEGGRAHPYEKKYMFEGHPNQFLAIMAVAAVPGDHKLKADKGTITIGDMVRHAQANIKSGEEVAWSLWAMSYYIGTEARWKNKRGETWSIERLVQLQCQEPTAKAACGGTHGMFALAFARNEHLAAGNEIRGPWLEADQRIRQHIEIAKANQNSDGTLSNDYFQGRSYSADFETRLNSCGHTLEFLMMALPDERLDEQWVRNAVWRMSRDLIENKSVPVECGALYHAVNALVIYCDRKNAPRRAAN